MLEKIKTAFYWVMLPFMALLAIIYYLLGKVNRLQSTVARQQAEQELGDTVSKIQEAGNEADKAESDYRAVVDAYEREHGKSD